MAQTVSNVSAAKPPVGGSIFVADITATMPTSADGELGTDWIALGYISEDGLSNDNAPDAEVIKAWGGDPVLSIYGSKEDTFQFELLEVLNVDVLKLVFGAANVSGSLATGITIKANNEPLDDKAFVFDMILRNNTLKRIVIPIASVTDVGTIEYSDSAAVGYDTTITAQADAAGNTHYEYIKAAKTNNG